MVSDLKVNFWNSCLIGVNVRNQPVELAFNFINCSQGSIPFKYLGTFIG